MIKVHAYLARIKEQEKDVIAVPDGAGRAICVSSDKHWTLTREWDELHIIAPLVEDEGNDDELERLRKSLAGSRDAHQRTVQAHETMKRSFDLSLERVLELKRELNAAIEERNEQKARAEQAEKRHTWPKVTPTGHTYVEPRTYEALCHEHSNAAQADVECWEADECPPEPTWEMVGIAHREVERLQRDLDEWKARAEAAEASTAPAVTKADIEKAIRGKVWAANRDPNKAGFHRVHVDWATDAVWSLMSGDDPAVHVVRESDLPEVWRYNKHNLVGEFCRHWWTSDGDWAAHQDSDAREARAMIPNYLRKIAGWEATARAIEAEQATDPIEEKARELYWAATPDARWETVADEYRRIARHVLGEEDDRHVDQ